jgi:hypothetical protein
VTTTDPWTGATWKVHGGGKYLKPTDRDGEFTLTAVADPATGVTAYYRVAFADGYMPACWKGCLLYPRGNVAFPPPVPLLPPWSTATESLWAAAAAAALQQLNVSMARLEADLYPGSNAQALTLVRVDNASTDGSPLLAMQLKSASSGGAQPMEDDGTGNGTH